MLTYYFKTVKDEVLKAVPEPRTGVWLQAVNPTEEELAEIIKTFSLDPDIVQDATDLYEVPRMERSGGATYFFTRYPLREVAPDNGTAPLLIVVGESFVITISIYEVPPFKRLISGEIAIFTTQKAKLFIAMMNILTISFDRELLRLRKAVHKDRGRLQSIGPREIERLVGFEGTLNNMVDALIPTNVWLQQVTKGSHMQLFAEDVAEMEDLVIANSQVVQSARSILKTIQNVRGASEAIMTSRLNNSLRILTILTILLTVPMVIASLYGMNVDLPFQHSPMAFFGIVAFSFTVLVGIVWFFKHKQWF